MLCCQTYLYCSTNSCHTVIIWVHSVGRCYLVSMQADRYLPSFFPHTYYLRYLKPHHQQKQSRLHHSTCLRQTADKILIHLNHPRPTRPAGTDRTCISHLVSICFLCIP